jgi:hypothetical protein
MTGGGVVFFFAGVDADVVQNGGNFQQKGGLGWDIFSAGNVIRKGLDLQKMLNAFRIARVDVNGRLNDFCQFMIHTNVPLSFKYKKIIP